MSNKPPDNRLPDNRSPENRSPEPPIVGGERRLEAARRIGLLRDQAEAYYRRGLKAFEDGDFENAILDLSEAIYYDRRFPEFYATRGLFYAENKQPEEARSDCEYALKLGKRTWLAHYVLGMLAFRDTKYEQALQHFNEAQRLAPRRMEVYYYRAATHHMLGMTEAAQTDMRRAYSLMPEDDKRRKEAKVWIKDLGMDDPDKGKAKPVKPDKPDAEPEPKRLKGGSDRALPPPKP
jgi:tetratricopeptide (TPR) repeat protein